MMTKAWFQEILDRAGIDLELIDDVEEVIEIAEDILFEVMCLHADGDETQPISSAEKAEILTEVAVKLVEALQTKFHGR